MPEEINNETRAPKIIKFDDPSLLHLPLTERIIKQLEPGQLFRNGSHAIIEIIAIDNDHVLTKFVKILKGNRVFNSTVFAQFIINKYFDQVKRVDAMVDRELENRLGFNRYLRN